MSTSKGKMAFVFLAARAVSMFVLTNVPSYATHCEVATASSTHEELSFQCGNPHESN